MDRLALGLRFDLIFILRKLARPFRRFNQLAKGCHASEKEDSLQRATPIYTISDVVELGNAHEHILSLIKDLLHVDDTHPNTLSAEDAIDE